jgi:hypothetical protein
VRWQLRRKGGERDKEQLKQHDKARTTKKANGKSKLTHDMPGNSRRNRSTCLSEAPASLIIEIPIISESPDSLIIGISIISEFPDSLLIGISIIREGPVSLII